MCLLAYWTLLATDAFFASFVGVPNGGMADAYSTVLVGLFHIIAPLLQLSIGPGPGEGSRTQRHGRWGTESLAFAPSLSAALYSFTYWSHDYMGCVLRSESGTLVLLISPPAQLGSVTSHDKKHHPGLVYVRL